MTSSRDLHKLTLVAAVVAQGLIRFGGLARDVVLARVLGFDGILAPYLFAFMLQSVLTGLPVSVVKLSLVPAFVRRISQLQRRMVRVLLLCATVSVAGGILATYLIQTPGLIAACLLFSIVPVLSSNVLSARLLAEDRQMLGVLPGLMVAVVPLAAVAVKGGQLSLRLLVSASLVGYFLETLALAALTYRQANGRGLPLRSAFQRSNIIGLGFASIISTVWLAIDLAAVRILGARAVGIYSIASRLPQGIASLLGVAVTNAILPSTSRVVTGAESMVNSWATFRRRVNLAMVAGVGLAILLAILTAVAGDFVFAGSEVSSRDIHEVVTTQLLLMAVLPVYISGIVLARYFQAADMHRPLLKAGVLAALVNVLADAGLGMLFGLQGIAVATVLAYAASTFYMFRYASRHSEGWQVLKP